MGDTITEIKLPKLGESISEATILEWKVREGDLVEKEQTVLEVSTDKIDSEIAAPESGKVTEILVKSDEVVKVGTILGKIDTSVKVKSTPPQKEPTQRQVGPRKPKRPRKQPAPQDSEPSSVNSQNTDLPNRKHNRFYSPLVEKIAQNHHISYEELTRIPSTGKGGRVRKSDIFNYIKDGRPAQFVQTVTASEETGFRVPDLKFDKGEGKRIEMDRMRQQIADHMVFSKHTSPHVTAYTEADMTAMAEWRETHKAQFEEKHGVKLTFMPLFVQAVAKALQDFPRINSSLDGKTIIEKEEINIGMATALPNGNLIVPVVKNADQKDLKDLVEEINQLAEKARNNRLKADDIQGGTFSISNVGTFGSLMGTPIINQPEAAILATGSIKKRAAVIEYEKGDQIEIRQMMYLSLSFDHRIVDGFLAGSFLNRVAAFMEGKDRL